MSRLNSHRQKEFGRKVILYIAILIGIMIFLYSVGLRLLVNTSLFIDNLTSKKTTQSNEQKNDFYGILDVDTIHTATNSARIIISGSVTNYNIVEFYINDKKVKEKKFSTSDVFSEEIGDLKPGENIVSLKAIAKEEKKEKKSPEYPVLYRNEKPKLEITDPSESSVKTRSSEIKVAGRTSQEVFIKVNELPIVVTSDSTFQTMVKLNDGDNTIVVIAEDSAGNTESKTITVTRQKDD